jgi:hypothetical protein
VPSNIHATFLFCLMYDRYFHVVVIFFLVSRSM